MGLSLLPCHCSPGIFTLSGLLVAVSYRPPKPPPPAKATPCKWVLDTRADVGLSPQILQHDCNLCSSLPSRPAASSYLSLPCQVLSKSVRNIIEIRFFCSNNVHSNLTLPPQQASKQTNLKTAELPFPAPACTRPCLEGLQKEAKEPVGVQAASPFLQDQVVTRPATRAQHLLLPSLGWGLGLGFGRVASERALGKGGGYLEGPHIPPAPNSKR